MTNRGKEDKKAPTQAYLPISEIKGDVVILKDGSLRSVILVSSVNFALKSEEEKDAIIFSFQSFLNSLSFPIQIVATSRKLDLSNYLNSVRSLAQKQDNPLLKIQTEEYSNFIETLLEKADIMEKRFYVVVPYFPFGFDLGGTAKDITKKKKAVATGNFEENKKKLIDRVSLVIQGLAGVGLRCAVLKTKDLLELYYTSYNPDTAQNQRLVDIDGVGQQVVAGGPKGGKSGAV